MDYDAPDESIEEPVPKKQKVVETSENHNSEKTTASSSSDHAHGQKEEWNWYASNESTDQEQHATQWPTTDGQGGHGQQVRDQWKWKTGFQNKLIHLVALVECGHLKEAKRVAKVHSSNSALMPGVLKTKSWINSLGPQDGPRRAGFPW